MTKHATGCNGTDSGCNGQTYLRCAQENGIDPTIWNRDSVPALIERAEKMLYVNMIEDNNGDLVDIEYFCDEHATHGEAWPGGMESDSPQFCAVCVHQDRDLVPLNAGHFNTTEYVQDQIDSKHTRSSNR